MLRYRLAVQGRGHGGTDDHTASDTVTVTVRAAPAVTAVALTSVPRADGEYRVDETIEVSVTFSAPVTVSTVSGTPTIGLAMGTEVRRAAYARNAAPAVLVFGYTVTAADTDDDGVAVPADGILLAGGTIVDGYGAPAFLGHDAVAADAAHRVDGEKEALTGGVCERTPQVRDAIVAAIGAASNCSEVTSGQLATITALRLNYNNITALKPGDFEGLTSVVQVFLSDNAISALPAGVFDGLSAVTGLQLQVNNLAAGSIEDGVFEPLTRVLELALHDNPGSASFVPKADAGADLVLRAGETATLGGPGTGGGPWGTNVEYAWVEVDAEGNPVAAAARTEGLSGETAARGGLHRAGARRGAGAALPAGGPGPGTWPHRCHTASDTVTVTVRAAPAVTAVAVTSVPQNRAGDTGGTSGSR